MIVGTRRRAPVNEESVCCDAGGIWIGVFEFSRVVRVHSTHLERQRLKKESTITITTNEQKDFYLVRQRVPKSTSLERASFISSFGLGTQLD